MHIQDSNNTLIDHNKPLIIMVSVPPLPVQIETVAEMEPLQDVRGVLSNISRRLAQKWTF